MGRPPLPPKPPVGGGEEGCDWIRGGGQITLPDFPAFPAEPDAFKAPVLPVPNLLPQWQREGFLQSLRHQPARTARVPRSWVEAGAGAAAGGGAAVLAALVLFGLKRKRSPPPHSGGKGASRTGGRVAVRVRG